MTISFIRLAMNSRLAARNLFRQRRRSLIALGSVAFGIASLIVASGYIEWMFLDFREATIESQYGHIQVTRPGYHENGRSDPFEYLLPTDTSAQPLDSLKPLRSWGPRLAFTGLVSKGEATVSFAGEGFDPERDLTGDRSLRIVQGSRLRTGQSEVLLGKGLATMLGAVAGDQVVVLVNTPAGGLNAIEARVAGLFESVSKAYDNSAILVPIEIARRLLKVDGAHSWLVYLDDTRHTSAAAADLRARLDPKQYEVRTWDQLAEFFNRAVELFRQQLDVVRFIVVAIILLGIANTMMMSVTERTGEIGTAMALGSKRRALLNQFLLEGAMIGLLGGVVGVILAFLVGAGVDALHIEMPPHPV
jgi:putative ABC transport system permease protein